MTRLLVLVEGESEEIFVKKILAPHLQRFGVYANATGVVSKRLANGQKFTGGNLWSNIHNSLRPLLADSDAWVTTLLDFYGLPQDFPGISNSTIFSGNDMNRVEYIQNNLAEVLGAPSRFIPFLVLHEFEAWYFADPEQVAEFYDNQTVAVMMKQACHELGGPENINHGKETHPSKRLESYGMGFRKTSGVTVLQKIGLDAIRCSCPHFNNWLTHLEKLGNYTKVAK